MRRNPSPPSSPSPPNYVILPKVSMQQGTDLNRRVHDRFLPECWNGQINLRIELLDSLHIGTGSSSGVPQKNELLLVRDILTTVCRAEGREFRVPVVPGSSIKGTIRTIFEALAGGCDEIGSCAPKFCSACALFGYVTREDGCYMSRLSWDDALPEDPTRAQKSIQSQYLPQAYGPRRQAGRRVYSAPTSKLRSEVPYAVVNRGTTFLTQCRFTNVTSAELGFVFLAMGLDGTFTPRLGGGKFAGLGRVNFEPLSAKLRKEATFESQDYHTDKLTEFIQQSIHKVPALPEREKVLDVLRDTMGVIE